MTRFRRLLLLAIMLLLPLQGMAAAVMPLLRVGGEAHAAMPCHEQAAEAHHDSAPNNTTPAPDGEAANHLCCHQVFTGVSFGVIAGAAHKFSDVSRLVLPLATLFIPDSPDRPPRG